MTKSSPRQRRRLLAIRRLLISQETCSSHIEAKGTPLSRSTIVVLIAAVLYIPASIFVAWAFTRGPVVAALTALVSGAATILAALWIARRFNR